MGCLPKNIAEEILAVTSDISANDQDQLVSLLLDSLQNNRSVFVAGAGRSLLVMKSFGMRLMHLGFNSHVVGDVSTPAIKENDVLIVGTGSGETSTLLRMVETADKIGATIIALTKSPASTIASFAKSVVIIPTGTLEESIQPSGSVFEQCLMVLCDSLVLQLIDKGDLRHELTLDEFIKIRHANLE